MKVQLSHIDVWCQGCNRSREDCGCRAFMIRTLSVFGVGCAALALFVWWVLT